MFGTYRLFLALAVVVTHIGHVEVLAGLAVWGFFMLSGYLITGVLQSRYGFDGRGLLSFSISRMLRLYPGYWCVALLTFAVTTWFRYDIDPQLVNSALAPMKGLREWASAVFILPHTNLGIGRVERALVPPIWAVDVEVTLYLLSCVFVSRSKQTARYSLVLSVLLFPLLWGVARGFLYAGDIDTAGQLLYSFIPAALLPYSTGAYLFFCAEGKGRFSKVFSVPVSIGIPTSFIMLLFVALVVSGYSNTLSYIGALPFLAYLLVALSRIRNCSFKRMDDFFGSMSYPIYLAHYLCAYIALVCGYHFSFAQSLLVAEAGSTYRYSPFGIGTIVVLTLAFSAMLALCLERPIERVRRGIATRLVSTFEWNR